MSIYIEGLNYDRLNPDKLAVVLKVKPEHHIYKELEKPDEPTIYQGLNLAIACGASPFSFVDAGGVDCGKLIDLLESQHYQVLAVVDPIPNNDPVQIWDCFNPDWGKHDRERREMMTSQIKAALEAINV